MIIIKRLTLNFLAFWLAFSKQSFKENWLSCPFSINKTNILKHNLKYNKVYFRHSTHFYTYAQIESWKMTRWKYWVLIPELVVLLLTFQFSGRKRVVIGHYKAICYLFPYYIMARVTRSVGVSSWKERRGMFKQSYVMHCNKLHRLLSDAIQLFFLLDLLVWKIKLGQVKKINK